MRQGLKKTDVDYGALCKSCMAQCIYAVAMVSLCGRALIRSSGIEAAIIIASESKLLVQYSRHLPSTVRASGLQHTVLYRIKSLSREP